ncbi:RNA polymerase sigma factor [Azoarcus sp. KH32C]|uniref:RNA polymerase sigma factor n=1 Tax=Azoarcus sp. KH32C TaxID=748247 RepID=UPI0002385EB9|nr:RNA polymerase sigma factor [Azoarcus sp. KH32C]BAL23983.1 ECF subfamily RNA polymerase, sigma-24 subunit [Azoarcus sp. KH32C]
MSPSDPPVAHAEPATETALVTRILAGDTLAFERMMRQHNRRLFRVARSILRDDADAEDAVQDGYIEAHRALAGFRGDAKLSTWLTRIIVNQALARRRRRNMPVATEEELDTLAGGDGDAPPETPETLAMRSELRRLIEASIDGLPDAYRTVFMLRAVEGLSVEETAATLGISSGNTKVRFLRARGQLRNALGAHLGSLLEDVFAFDGARCDRIVTQVCARLGLPAPSLTAPSLPASGESNPA